jgi:hypothetical protein
VQIFGENGQDVVVRDLTTGILYADEKMLVQGAPSDGLVEGAPWTDRFQSVVPFGPKLKNRFRGRVVECSVVRYGDTDRNVTSLAIDEDEAASSPYR